MFSRSTNLNLYTSYKKRKMLDIQICSDLHLEFYIDFLDFSTIVKPQSSNLALLGDIGYPSTPLYSNFLSYCSKSFKHVFLLSGNHEYYNLKLNHSGELDYDKHIRNMDTIDDEIRTITKSFNNIHFLQRDKFEIDGYTILGTTLWSNVSKVYQDIITKDSGDYKNIYVKNNPITIENVNNLFQTNVDWLTREIENNKDKKLIIMTHHLPSYNLIPKKYNGSLFTSCYASNLDYLINKDNIYGWLFGHSHTSVDHKINKCLAMSNPLGYPQTDNSLSYSYENEFYSAKCKAVFS